MKDFFSAQKPPAETNWNKDLRKWVLTAGLISLWNLCKDLKENFRKLVH